MMLDWSAVGKDGPAYRSFPQPFRVRGQGPLCPDRCATGRNPAQVPACRCCRAFFAGSHSREKCMSRTAARQPHSSRHQTPAARPPLEQGCTAPSAAKPTALSRIAQKDASLPISATDARSPHAAEHTRHAEDPPPQSRDGSTDAGSGTA